LPIHQQADIDPELADQNYVSDAQLVHPIQYAMSNSFAFGGVISVCYLAWGNK
jgi:3-oxoacyl-[acyl-carrier-protein] synthase-1